MDFCFLQEIHSSLVERNARMNYKDQYFLKVKLTLVEQQLDIQEVIKSTSQTKNRLSQSVYIYIYIYIYNLIPKQSKQQLLIKCYKLLKIYMTNIQFWLAILISFSTHPQTHTEINQLRQKKSIVKFIELKEKFDLRDIQRIRNPKTKRYTFHQKHVSGVIQRRPY